jgi:hypothetical protein
MILCLGHGGPGFESRLSPLFVNFFMNKFFIFIIFLLFLLCKGRHIHKEKYVINFIIDRIMVIRKVVKEFDLAKNIDYLNFIKNSNNGRAK